MAEDEKPKEEWHAGLSAKERRFVEEFVVDCNGTQAAIRAGYSKVSAHAQQNRMRKRSLVKAAIAKLLEQNGVSRVRVLEEYAAIAFVRIDEIVTITADGHVIVKPSAEWTAEQAAAVAEISETITEFGNAVRVSFHAKLTALAALAKLNGMSVERHEISGPNGGPIQTEEVDPLDRINERLNALRKARDAAAMATTEGES